VERETKIKDFVQNVSKQFQQVETLSACVGYTCPFCTGVVAIETFASTCSTDTQFAEDLKDLNVP